VAVKDTHKAFERLTGAGYSREMTEALLEVLGDSWDSLATKADIDGVRDDVKTVEKETKANLDAMEVSYRASMREQELRMRLHLYAVALVVIGVLAALELLPR
jgi:hypothetical protein